MEIGIVFAVKYPHNWYHKSLGFDVEIDYNIEIMEIGSIKTDILLMDTINNLFPLQVTKDEFVKIAFRCNYWFIEFPSEFSFLPPPRLIFIVNSIKYFSRQLQTLRTRK